MAYCVHLIIKGQVSEIREFSEKTGAEQWLDTIRRCGFRGWIGAK
jgi:hypothetical protein